MYVASDNTDKIKTYVASDNTDKTKMYVPSDNTDNTNVSCFRHYWQDTILLLQTILTEQMYAASGITDTQLEFSQVQDSIRADE